MVVSWFLLCSPSRKGGSSSHRQRRNARADFVVETLNPSIVISMDGLLLGIVLEIGALFVEDAIACRRKRNRDDGGVASEIQGAFQFPRLLDGHDPPEFGAGFNDRALNLLRGYFLARGRVDGSVLDL